MENEEEKKKKLNDDVVVFLRKRSETEAPRYAARLHAYVDLHRKLSRVTAAKLRSDHGQRKISANKKKGEMEQKDKNAENSGSIPCSARKSNCGITGEQPVGDDDRVNRRRGEDKAGMGHGRSSRSHSREPSDACCGRRKRRRSRSCRRRPRRRRSRRRRSRRRRSCRRRRRSSRRRRRRSCRRRSCQRRRRRRRCR